MSIFNFDKAEVPEFPYPYKLLISDLDGTLLNRHQEISERTLNLIKRFKAMGGVFTIATGRNEISAAKYVNLLGIDVPYIIYNGAKIVSDKGVVFDKRLPKDIAQETITLLKGFNCDILLYFNNAVYIEKLTNSISEHLEKDCNKAELVDDLRTVLNSDPYKILVICEDKEVGNFLEDFARKFKNAPNIVRSEETYVEVLPQGVSKGAALKVLSHMVGISLPEIMAFGDNLNDLEMLNLSGLGVAMGNADPMLIKNAGYITDSNDEEGVAKVLEMLLNGDLKNKINR